MYRWFRGQALPHKDATGAVVKWLGLATDIDEQKRTELRLLQREAELAHASQSLEAQVAVRTQDLDQEVLRLREEIRRLTTC